MMAAVSKYKTSFTEQHLNLSNEGSVSAGALGQLLEGHFTVLLVDGSMSKFHDHLHFVPLLHTKMDVMILGTSLAAPIMDLFDKL